MTHVEMAAVGSADLQHEVEQFLYAECDLLDRRKFPEWLDLFAADGRYWIPSGFDDLDPSRKVSLVHDNVKALAERVWRLEGGLAYAQQPTSRTVRLISNVQITAVEERDGVGVVSVQAKSITAEFRRGTQTNHAARLVYTLERFGDTFRILLKKVELVNNDGFLGNLGLPL